MIEKFALVLVLFVSGSLAQANNETDPSQRSALESFFGQIAKTVVYGGATLMRINNHFLCPLLTHETEIPNEDQPTLFIFNNHLNSEQAYRIYADDNITSSMIIEAQFDASQMTFIYVHGWLGGIQNEHWLSAAKNAALLGNGADDRFTLRTPDSIEPIGHSRQVVAKDNNNNYGENGSGRNSEKLAARFRPNVIIVDWSELAHGSLYEATQNSLRVSRRLGRLLEQLAEIGGLKPELMHCLGHSIGAHICGQAARYAFGVPDPNAQPSWLRQQANEARLPRRMGRITGLDTGGFCYELGIDNEATFSGLRPSDALLVDSYYSNRSPFGNKYQVGTYNVRVSNGFFQRPCSVWRNSTIASQYFRAAARFVLGNTGKNEILACDHYFATLFAAQLLPPTCSYISYACTSYRHFLRGRCGLCKTREQCYKMDFEYQRPEASVEHALSNIDQYTSYYNNIARKPLGGVTYNERRIYYMRISNEEPYCTHAFRIRLVLDSARIDLRSFRTDWLKVKLLNSQGQVIKVKESSSSRWVESLNLHGPWSADDAYMSYENHRTLFGVDERTLTTMFEVSNLNENIHDVLIVYNNERSRRQDPLMNPIHQIELDYLSSADERIRLKNSHIFQGNSIKIQYRQLEPRDGIDLKELI